MLILPCRSLSPRRRHGAATLPFVVGDREPSREQAIAQRRRAASIRLGRGRGGGRFGGGGRGGGRGYVKRAKRAARVRRECHLFVVICVLLGVSGSRVLTTPPLLQRLEWRRATCRVHSLRVRCTRYTELLAHNLHCLRRVRSCRLWRTALRTAAGGGTLRALSFGRALCRRLRRRHCRIGSFGIAARCNCLLPLPFVGTQRRRVRFVARQAECALPCAATQ